MNMQDIQLGAVYCTTTPMAAIGQEPTDYKLLEAGTEVIVFGKNDTKFAPHCTSVAASTGDGFSVLISSHYLKEVEHKIDIKAVSHGD